MKRDINALTATEFDVLVIGGGAFGAAAAWNSALRGLSTAVIERGDFGAGASAECFKIVHGGIRYLQHADVGRLRSSAHERSALLRIAPHLVSPLPIAIPTYGSGRNSKAFLGAGMHLYDMLTHDRNEHIRDSSRRIRPTRFLGRQELLAMFPDLEHPTLTGAAVFEDGQMYNPPRLVLAFVKSAVRAGAIACNYVEARSFLWKDDRVCGVRAFDRLDGTEIEIRAKLVLNAAGPGAEYLLEGEGRFNHWRRGAFSRDACFIVDRRPTCAHALAIQGKSRDRDALVAREARHMFVVPWRDCTLIGVWHRPFPAHPDQASIGEDELLAWIDEINRCRPGFDLEREEVIYTNCGLVPFGDGTTDISELSFGKESRFIDHARIHGVRGLVTLIGIRFTTARGDAGKALEMLLAQMPGAPAPPDTERTALAGGDIESFSEFQAQAQRERPASVSATSLTALLRNHGTEFRGILDATHDSADGAATLPGTHTLAAEVDHAVRQEMAMRLEDVILRRTDAGTARDPGMPAIEGAAARMQAILGWSDRRRDDEIAATRSVLARHCLRPTGTEVSG